MKIRVWIAVGLALTLLVVAGVLMLSGAHHPLPQWARTWSPAVTAILTAAAVVSVRGRGSCGGLCGKGKLR